MPDSPVRDSEAGPRVLCIAGSPRRRGNSERLMEACSEGVESAGGTSVRLVVVERGISPCRGCNLCSRDGVCVIDDPMKEVYAELDACDAIIVCSPVFFASVPAVLKALYDRCQPYWARRHVLGQPARQPRRPGALVLARGGGDPHGVSAAVIPTQSVFGVLGVDYTDELVVVGLDGPKDIEAHPDALRDASETARRIVAEAARRQSGTG